MGGRSDCSGNALEVTDGATIQAATDCAVNSANGRILVDDATLSAGWGYTIGSSSAADCTMTVRGTKPIVRNTGTSLRFQNGARLVLELPAAGYASGYATYGKPVISAHTTIAFDATSTLELQGAAELLQGLAAKKQKGEYVLLQSPTLTFADGNLDALRAALPDGVTLEEVQWNGYRNLVLKVKPRLGFAFYLN